MERDNSIQQRDIMEQQSSVMLYFHTFQFIINKVSLLMKLAQFIISFEREAAEVGVQAKRYNTDNGVYTVK